MDNGEVLQAINEPWTLLGAKLNEWIAGFAMFILGSEFLVKKVTTGMPILMLLWCGTAYGLAGIRRKFPDEERGIMHYVCWKVGVKPPLIPSPSYIQPVWSGMPQRSLKPDSRLVTSRLLEALETPDEEEGKRK